MYHPDTWYLYDGSIPAGFVPMGPHNSCAGPADGLWESRFGMQTSYPPADALPVEEMWFENRFVPGTAEFVIADITYAAPLATLWAADVQLAFDYYSRAVARGAEHLWREI